MISRKIAKRSLLILSLAFIAANILAYTHAYKFTHFDSSEKKKTKNATSLSFGQKLQALFLGISNPRPKNKIYPARNYQTIKLKSNKEIEGWLIPIDSSKGTVILFHGYGGEKSSMLDKANIFNDLGYNCLLIDFMGQGAPKETKQQ